MAVGPVRNSIKCLDAFGTLEFALMPAVNVT